MLSTVANHLWQSTLFAAAIVLLVPYLRDNGAHTRYWLWFAVSVKFLIPFSVLAALGGRLAFDIAPADAFADWSGAAARIAAPVSSAAGAGLFAYSLLAVWLAGAACVMGVWVVRASRVRSMLRGARQPRRHAFDVPAQLPVSYSPTLGEPALVGLFRPVLVLPERIEDHLSPSQLSAVVAHELCHWQRRDNLTAAIHMLVEALVWFHPLVWWIGARLVEERELACDEAVVAAGHERKAYAEGILNVCDRYVASSVVCAAGISGADLQRRIGAIMKEHTMKPLHLAKRTLLVSLAAGALLIPIAVGLLSQSTALAQEEDYILIVKVAPYYPERALTRGLDGYAVVEYTITAQGRVTDLHVVESSSSLFDEAALDAVAKWKYGWRPNRVPVEVPNVRSRIEFSMDGDLLPEPAI